MKKTRLATLILPAALMMTVTTIAAADNRALAEDLLESLKTGTMSIEPDRLEEIKLAVEAVAKSEPKSADWKFALSMIARQENQRVRAKELMQEAVDLDSSNAFYQYWLGGTVFEGINDVNMFSKMSWSKLGKASYEKAIELDPDHVDARVGLVQFYLNAPAIAGGSVAKAKLRAEELLDIDGGAFNGHILLAQIAEKSESWDEYEKQLIAAESTADSDDQRYQAAFQRAWTFLTTRNDASSAREPAETLIKLKPDDGNARFVMGRVLHEAGDHQGAIEQYLMVMKVNPEAMNTRYHLGECYEATDQPKQAAKWYTDFASAFPDDDRAGSAKKKAETLGE